LEVVSGDLLIHTSIFIPTGFKLLFTFFRIRTTKVTFCVENEGNFINF